MSADRIICSWCIPNVGTLTIRSNNEGLGDCEFISLDGGRSTLSAVQNFAGVRFPTTNEELRDYFAAQAMMGAGDIDTSRMSIGDFRNACDRVAINAYGIADAMLKARTP